MVPPDKEEEEEDCEFNFSLLFGPPEEHDWANVSEPYVPKFPTEEEIRQRKERRKEQLKQVMEPITRPVSEPDRGRDYFMDQPGTALTRDAMPPDRPALFNNWNLSDKSECKHIYMYIASPSVFIYLFICTHLAYSL